MNIVVLGAGVIGVCSAYELACDGHDVVVIDRRDDVALETSFANGGQLSSDHGEPLAAPGAIKRALKWLGKHDAPLLYRLRLDPALWSWTLKFLANSSEPRFWENAARILRIAQYSRERMAQTLSRETIAFDHLTTGILNIYQDPKDFDRSLERAHTMKELGAQQQMLDRQGCIKLEPSLAHSALLIAGGIYTPRDESGDCYTFTKELAQRCEKRGVEFQFNTTVQGFTKDSSKISTVETDQGPVSADVFIMALGSYSPMLMRGLGLKLPIYPTKGYSVTVPVIDDAMAPKVSITSQEHRLVFSRLGNKLRVAGMLEFNGYDTNLDDQRARIVLDNALKVFPRAAERTNATYWTGLRPMTPDGVPVLGRGHQENLILNTGHGMLGWTMAMGSARVSADLVAGRAPQIDLDGLGWERFS
ncbi:MAG: D-amino acid dehydrogenase [Magnetovibrio sp.]|nr:D-amino acid dehydrogenase [Magnetovibrio sp.]